MGFPGGSVVKNPSVNAGDASLILGLVRSPGEGNGNPLQYSCLGNPMDRGVWWATVHRVTELDTPKFPDTPGSLEGNTEGPGTTSSEPLFMWGS